MTINYEIVNFLILWDQFMIYLLYNKDCYKNIHQVTLKSSIINYYVISIKSVVN